MREKRRAKHSIIKNILLWTFQILVVILFAYVLVYFFGQSRTNIGQSMDVTLSGGDTVLLNTLIYQVGSPKRGDVIAFKPNGSGTGHSSIKRVIGLPGDTIYAKDDVVYVNGMPIEEPYLDNDYADSIRLTENYKFTEDFDEVQLGEDEYYLMGDNRYASKDSREMGAFKRGDIKAVDFFIVLPFNKMRVAE